MFGSTQKEKLYKGERHREGNRASEGKTVFTIHYILYTLLNAYAEQLFKLYKFRTAFLYLLMTSIEVFKNPVAFPECYASEDAFVWNLHPMQPTRETDLPAEGVHRQPDTLVWHPVYELYVISAQFTTCFQEF